MSEANTWEINDFTERFNDKKFILCHFSHQSPSHHTPSLLAVTFVSVDNLFKQFESRSGPTKCRSCSGPKLFDSLIVFLKEFLKKIILKKVSRQQQKHEKLPSLQNSFIMRWQHFEEATKSCTSALVILIYLVCV